MLLLWLRLECRLGTLHRPIHGLTKWIRLLLLLLCEWISLLLVEAGKSRNNCLLDLGISSERRRLHLLLEEDRLESKSMQPEVPNEECL